MLRQSVRNAGRARDASWLAVVLAAVGGLYLALLLGYAALQSGGAFDPPAVADVQDSRMLRQYNSEPILAAAHDPGSDRLWLGTKDGIEVFNPRTRLWRTLRPAGPQNLPVAWLNRDGNRFLAGDGEGAVIAWDGSAGLRTLFGSRGARNLIPEAVAALGVGPEEVLLTDGHSLSIYNRTTRSWSQQVCDGETHAWRPRPDVEGLEAKTARIRAICPMPDEDACYVGTDAGLFRRRRGRWDRLPDESEEPVPPVRCLTRHGPELWYVLQGTQESLHTGRFRKNGDFEHWLSPSRIALPPETIADAAKLGKFLFLASTSHFLRVCNWDDHSWEAVDFSNSGDAPTIRMMEIANGRLWLATDRGLHVFGSPERLWEVAREAKIPVFQSLYGSLASETDTGQPQRKAGVRKLVPSDHALLFVTERQTLARIDEAAHLSWLVPESRAVRSAKGMDKGTGYWLRKPDILCGLETPDGVLVGSRRGLFRYDCRAHTWEEHGPERIGDQTIYDLKLDPVRGEIVALTQAGIVTHRAVTPHPAEDLYQRLHQSPAGIFYSTRKGGLGLLAGEDLWPAPLIGRDRCPVPLNQFTSVAARGDLVYFGTDGEGILAYDKVRRRWQGRWRANEGPGGAGRGMLSNRVWEIRAGDGFLAYRTADGAVGLRCGDAWQALIGSGRLDGVSDEQLTAACEAGQTLWVGGNGFVAAYDRPERSWRKPLALPDPSPVVRIGEFNGVPVSLTAAGNLFLEKRPIAAQVSSFASDGRILGYVSGGTLRLHGPLVSGRPVAELCLPPAPEIVDVAETEGLFLVATANRLYAYRKSERCWTDWGGHGKDPILELAALKNDRALARTGSGQVYACQPAGLWPEVSPALPKVTQILRPQGQAWLLTGDGYFLREGDSPPAAADVLARTPLLDVRQIGDQTLFLQEDALRRYEQATGRWLRCLRAPEGKKLRTVGGSERFWAVTTDGCLYSAPVPGERSGTAFVQVFDPKAASKPGPVEGLAGIARLGERLYLAGERALHVYDLRSHQWLSPLRVEGHTIASLAASQRFLALVTRQGQVLLSSQLFEGRIPHESLERDWTLLNPTPGRGIRKAGLSDRGHFVILAEDGAVTMFDPFVKRTTSVMPRAEGEPMVHDIAIQAGTLWVATEDGLRGFSLSEREVTPLAPQLAGVPVTKLAVRQDSVLALARKGEVWGLGAQQQWERSGLAPEEFQVIRRNSVWQWLEEDGKFAVRSAIPGVPATDPATGGFSFDNVTAIRPWKDSVWVATPKALLQYPISEGQAFLDPEIAVVHPIPGVVRLEPVGDRLYAVGGDKAYRLQGRQLEPAARLPESGPQVLAKTKLWEWEWKNGTIGGTLTYLGGKRSGIDLAAVARTGRFAFDQVLSAAASTDGGTLWLSTTDGLVRMRGREREVLAVAPATKLQAARSREGAEAVLGVVDGRLMRLDEAGAVWDPVASETDWTFAETVRADSGLWTWERTDGRVVGRFKDAPETPVWTKTDRGTVFSFDDVRDVTSFGAKTWIATSAGPLAVKLAPEPTPLSELRIAKTGPVEALCVHISAAGEPPALFARPAGQRPGAWRLDDKRERWQPAPDASPFGRELAAAGPDWLFETVREGDPAQQRLRKLHRCADGAWQEFRLTRGRWSFDDVRAMAAVDDALWLATSDGFAEYRVRQTEEPRVSPARRFGLPGDIRWGMVSLKLDQGTLYACGRSESAAAPVSLAFDPAGGRWKAGAQTPPELAPERAERLRAPCWAWTETRSSETEPPRLEGKLLFVDGTEQPVTLQDGRFAFDCFTSVVGEAERVWLSTPAGVAECGRSGNALPLEEVRLHPVGREGGQLLGLTAAAGSLSPGVYLRGRGKEALQYDGNGKWAPVENPPPILWDGAGKHFLVEFNGFWRWWREVDADPSQATQKPLVHTEGLDSAGRWTEIGFEDGRFAFDRVNDVALHEGRVWLATEAGLCRYPEAADGLDLRQAKLHPDLAEATDLSVDRATNELFVRLQGLSQAVYSLSLPDGAPQKVTAGNPFQARVRVETARSRWSRHEIYEGNEVKGTRIQLDLRDARDAWQPVPLRYGLLPADNVRDILLSGDTLWLATEAGVVAYPLSRPTDLDAMRFYPETGDTFRLLLRTAEGGEKVLLCLSRSGQKEVVSRFHSLAKQGRNWEQAEETSFFRQKLLEDGPWHWYQERRGISILERGLSGRPRVLQGGRFADEIVLAAAGAGDRLYAYTPVGLARLIWHEKRSRLRLDAILRQTGQGESLPADRKPAAMAVADGKLYVAVPEGVFELKVEESEASFSVSRHWPMPGFAAPVRSLCLSAEREGIVLRVSGEGSSPGSYGEYVLSDGGLVPMGERKTERFTYVYEAKSNSLKVRLTRPGPGGRSCERQVSLGPGEPPLAVFASHDRIWLVRPGRVQQVSPQVFMPQGVDSGTP
jgi:ligand-binding sensor domain-containing protein